MFFLNNIVKGSFSNWYISIFWIVLGYVLGSIPFGLIIPKIWKNVDPRKWGSGSSGTTNVYRSAGWKCAVCVAFADILKSMVPVLCVLKGLGCVSLAMGVALSGVVGHIWSCFLKFKGGKGVATGAGALFPFIPYWIGISMVLWFVLARYTRYAVLASIIATVTVIVGGSLTRFDALFTLFTMTLGGIIFFAHKKNFVRLTQGKENRIDTKIHEHKIL
ncbi:glycerol-3-phosphate 1-O-acyltransferase PlsY [Holospora curviuscula]|uniref:Glycerol-3-phosphate acyltransferase n=1 Tax=Holospora curviuscula TaxID=1082868 RepID=A0A2S5RDE1_9PROT|nr:glycerol-3-phosphate 1-O-acyltransferase PlsY [Holospora curviuscula]PPE05330.1 Glycerol-3-phosphate acyltransferase [Holospora curviuscula]